MNLSEVEPTIKKFSKSNSLGPEGWTMDLFLHFFDLMGQYLLNVIEEVRSTMRISGDLNSTFIALIPKLPNPSSFDDFMPIVLWNLVYKIIVDGIKPKLVECMSQEQFAFFE